jgi:phosphonate transport system permease protein
MTPSNLRRTVFDAINFAVIGIMVLAAILRPTEDALLDLNQNFLVFSAFAFTGAAVSYFLNRGHRRTLGELLFAPPAKQAIATDHGLFKSLWGWQIIVSGAITLTFGAFLTGFSIVELLDEQGLVAAKNLFMQLANPDWRLLPQAVLKVIETIFIALMATVLAVPLAFLLCFLSAKNIMTGPVAFGVYGVLRTLFNVMRSVEPIIWAIIFSVWVGIGPFAGMLALMIQSVASLTKQFSELVESVSEGPIEGVKATGANTIQTIWFGIVPQVTLPFISFTIYRWDINVRMATIIGFAGGGGIGTLLYQYSMRAMWPQVGCLIFVIALVVWILDVTSAYVREALK